MSVELRVVGGLSAGREVHSHIEHMGGVGFEEFAGEHRLQAIELDHGVGRGRPVYVSVRGFILRTGVKDTAVKPRF